MGLHVGQIAFVFDGLALASNGFDHNYMYIIFNYFYVLQLTKIRQKNDFLSFVMFVVFLLFTSKYS